MQYHGAGVILVLSFLTGICTGFAKDKSLVQNQGVPSCDVLGARDEYFPNVHNCHDYFLCRKGHLQAAATLITCPFPTQFSSDKKSCIWTGRYDCTSSPHNSTLQKGVVGHQFVELTPGQSYPNQEQNITSTIQQPEYTSSSEIPRASDSTSTQDDSSTLPVDFSTNSPSPDETTSSSTSTSSSSALQTWINYAFISSFSTNLAPSPAQVKLGSAIFTTLSRDGQGDRGLGHAFTFLQQNLSLTRVKNFAEKLHSQGLISSEELAELTSTIFNSEPGFFSTIREYVAVDDACAAELIYGLRGIVQTSEEEATVLTSSQRLKLNIPIPVWSTRRTAEDCILGGQFCRTELVLGDLSGTFGDALMSWLRAQALSLWNAEQASAMEGLEGRVRKEWDLLPERIKALGFNGGGPETNRVLEEVLRNEGKLGG